MLSHDSRPSSYDLLRQEYLRRVLTARPSHSPLVIRPGRSRCRCRRQSFLIFALYAAVVLLFQKTLIAYYVNTPASSSVTAITRAMTDAVNVTSIKSNVETRSSVALSPLSSRTTVTPTRPSTRPLGPLTEKEYYSRRSAKVNEYRYNAVLVPTGLCRPGTLMVILVHSAAPNQDRREAIRITWGEAVLKGTWPNTVQQDGSPLSRLHIAFVLGLHQDETLNHAVRQEHAKYNDIVQGDFIDNYRNMTLKSLLDLKVVHERCPGVQYLLKSDDDMVINLPYLLDILTSRRPSRSFMGPYNPRSRVNREGVWKLTPDEFPFAYYPPYESGSAYVITGDLIHELFVTAEYVPHIFVDDVYVTGILGRILGVSHVRQQGFAYWGSKTPTACDLVSRKIVTGTKMHPQRLCSLWNDLQLKPKC